MSYTMIEEKVWENGMRSSVMRCDQCKRLYGHLADVPADSPRGPKDVGLRRHGCYVEAGFVIRPFGVFWKIWISDTSWREATIHEINLFYPDAPELLTQARFDELKSSHIARRNSGLVVE